MKYYLYTIGMFLTSFAATLVSIFVVGRIIYATFGKPSDFVLFLVIVPVFFVALLGSMRLYAKYIHLSCPECGSKLKMDNRPGTPVTYHCEKCNYLYRTSMTIGSR